MRRKLAVCVVMAVAALAWAADRHLEKVRAATATLPVLTLTAPAPPAGCPLGTAFTYCTALTGSPGAWYPMTVSNTSANAVTGIAFSFAAVPGALPNFAAADFTIQAGGSCGSAPLGAGASCTVNVAFTPTASGPRMAALTATDSSGDTAYVNLSGSGGNLALALPTLPPCPQYNAFTFCPTPLGGTSAAQSFPLTTGSGASSVQISLAAIPGLAAQFSPGDFTIETPLCSTALPANGSCAILISFTPKAAGLRAAALSVTDSSGDAVSVYLAGTTGGGIVFAPPAAAAPCWQSNPYGYCNEPTGGITPTRAYTLTNTSAATVTGLNVGLSNPPAQPDFLLSGTSCTSTLAPGASCALNIAFTPTAVGLRQAAFTASDAQGDAAGISVEGAGDDYELVVSLPSQITVVQGGSGTFNAQIVSSGAFGQNGEQVTFICASLYLPINTSCVITPCPTPAVAGGSAPYQIALATSSTITVAPIPTVPCSAYGPSSSVAYVVPPGGAGRINAPGGAGQINAPGGAGKIDAPRDPREWSAKVFGAAPVRFPAPLPLAALAVLLALAATVLARGGMSARPGSRPTRRAALVLTCLVLAAALAGCHHHSAVVGDATPTGTTALTMLGNALDANGKPLNSSRQFQVSLVVGP